MPLPEFTHLKYSELELAGYYHILWSAFSVQVVFHCPRCVKEWRGPVMSTAWRMKEIKETTDLPLPFKCICGYRGLLLFDGVMEIIKGQYEQ